MTTLTKSQTRILRRLERRWRELGRQPNLSDLAGELDMTYVGLKEHLKALEKKGRLHFESQGRGKSPIIHLERKEAEGVPLVGDIAAGSLRGEVEHLEGYLALPGDDGRFALRVQGDSMAERIADGDVVIFSQEQPHSGDICAVRYEDEVTLKYLELYANGGALLRPHNPAYDPIEVRLKDIFIAGRFDSLLRGSIVHLLFREPS